MSERLRVQAAVGVGVIGDIIGVVGDGVRDAATASLNAFGEFMWEAGLQLLSGGLSVADKVGGVDLSIGAGPLAPVWPVTIAVGVALAGLLFWMQLISTAARGGRGVLRALTGGVQFGIALAASAGFFAALVGLADGLTSLFLEQGLQASNFTEAFDRTGISDSTANAVKGPALLVMAVFGLIPISLGFAFENVLRAAVIYLLVGVIPITAAGLLFGPTRSWFWTTSNWCMAAIMVKPVMALAVWLGVAIAGGGQGLNQLITGLAVLFVALFSPLGLFKLFAFISDEAADGFRAGLAQAKDFVSSGGSSSSDSSPAGANKSMESASDASYSNGSSADTDTASAAGDGGRTDSVFASTSQQGPSESGGAPGGSPTPGSGPDGDGDGRGGGPGGGPGGGAPTPRPPRPGPGPGSSGGGGAAAGAEELAVAAV